VALPGTLSPSRSDRTLEVSAPEHPLTHSWAPDSSAYASRLYVLSRKPLLSRVFREIRRIHSRLLLSGRFNLEFSSPVRRAGALISVHLFRERHTALHHEFVILSTRALTGGETSYLRVERAARIKKRWLQLDSLGPVIDSVTLRESVAFSTSKDSLIGDSDELASTGVISSSAVSLDVDGILLPLIGEQLSNTSETFPKYSLFTTNCRWFLGVFF